jgi:hypothetical protein
MSVRACVHIARSVEAANHVKCNTDEQLGFGPKGKYTICNQDRALINIFLLKLQVLF